MTDVAEFKLRYQIFTVLVSIHIAATKKMHKNYSTKNFLVLLYHTL